MPPPNTPNWTPGYVQHARDVGDWEKPVRRMRMTLLEVVDDPVAGPVRVWRCEEVERHE